MRSYAITSFQSFHGGQHLQLAQTTRRDATITNDNIARKMIRGIGNFTDAKNTAQFLVTGGEREMYVCE